MNYTPEQLRELASCYEGCHGELGSLRDLMRANADKIEECERYRTAMQHWREYWNGSENERAMADALHHIMDGIDAALKESK